MTYEQLPVLELIYEGSVKRVYKAPTKPDRLWFEFTDDYSVFDWGKMPDTIANKGRSLSLIGAYLFDRLARPDFWKALTQSPHLQKFDRQWLDARFNHRIYSGPHGLTQEGMPNHFCSLVQDSEKVRDLNRALTSTSPLFFEVLAADVERPVSHHIYHHTLYLYTQSLLQAHLQKQRRRMLPLEIVFRFGMPSGSSLTDRLNRDPFYAKTLGVEVSANTTWFSHPVLEFYTKLEPKDRLLSWQEAALMSGLSGESFEDLAELSLDTALALHVIFADRRIDLWDGKVEMAAENDRLMLADSIGPDELRLMYQGCHLSKEMIRQMYRGSPWEVSVKEAQELSRHSGGRAWKEIAREDLGAAPEPLPPTFKALVDRLYGVIANALLGAEIFKDHPTLDDFVRSLPAYLISDIAQTSPLKPVVAAPEE